MITRPPWTSSLPHVCHLSGSPPREAAAVTQAGKTARSPKCELEFVSKSLAQQSERLVLQHDCNTDTQPTKRTSTTADTVGACKSQPTGS